MRVLQVPPRYPPFLGGVEAVAEVTAANLRRLGHQCEVVCADRPAGAPREVSGVRVTRLPVLFSIANTQIAPGLPAFLLRSRCDVVHGHLPAPWWGDWAMLIGRLRGHRTVLTVHNDICGTGVEGVVAAVYRNTVQRLTMWAADAIIVLSPGRGERLRRDRPSLAARVHVIPNGVDQRRFSPPSDPGARNPRLLFVGRLDRFHRYKGLDVLLQAIAGLATADLDIVGTGELAGTFEALAGELGIASRVRFLGDVAAEDLLVLYRSNGVFVLPSIVASWEGGSSLAALEAMACGMPVVIATGAGDIAREAAEQGAGLAVPPSDAVALRTAIARLLDDVGARQAMGDAARRYVVEQRRWDEVIARYVKEAYEPDVPVTPPCGSPAGERIVTILARLPGDRRNPVSGAARVVVRWVGRHRDGADVRYRDRHGYWHTASRDDHMEAVGRFGLEERLPRVARVRVRPGDWVIDVGANVGFVTADLCARVGSQGVVWAVEPVPKNVHRLETLQRQNDLPQLRVLPAALSDRTGQAKLRLPRGGQSGWASFTKSWDTGLEIDVATWRLDDLRPRFPDRRLTLLKLDVEGFEPQVIDGAAETLARHRPVVVCEFNEILLRDAGSSSMQLAGALSRLGYRPLTPWRPRRRTQDLVFVPLSRAGT